MSKKQPRWILCRLGVPGMVYYVYEKQSWTENPKDASVYDSKYQARQARARAKLDPNDVCCVSEH